MNLDRYKAQHGLTNDDIISIIRPVFPKFGKAQVSMVNRGVYGICLAPQAVKLLNDRHPKKENRKKAHKLTVRLNDEEYNDLVSLQKESGATMQDLVELFILRCLILCRNGEF